MQIGFIGGGKMAEAIVAALIRSKLAGPHEISAGDVSAERRRLLKERYGINMYSRNRVVVSNAKVLVLAVKPQAMQEVLSEIAGEMTPEHLVISIAAGKRLAWLESILPKARLVRVMPNMPAMVGHGMSVFCAGRGVTAVDRKTVQELLSSFGRVLELPETRFDLVTAVSGSGPAFLAYVVNGMIEMAVAEGLDRDDAGLLAVQTMQGTARVLLDQGMDARALIQAVASPGGTTEAGLAVLEKSKMTAILRDTLKAAMQRSEALSKG
ncbi:MAG: pyrroline-5-carboxylate reductase [Lentisphaerae bacterium RIFOXYC12_FULL_60_16]|nr:MAG: pyrroline-5-carboxylate reductase [Lentisphaerae bacterium RIFOXYC12_FULL_60_16]OGV85439.1 MAG: pyrroline-5-carboxylate reductase [Lentisphaerae bacterium RIFOXYB12_FULL_60_10]